MTPQTGIYTGAEEQKLSSLQNASDNATLAYSNAQINYNDANSNRTLTATAQGPKFHNPSLMGDALLSPAQYDNALTALKNNIPVLKETAVQALIALNEYKEFLKGKYTQAFNAAHPELAPTLAQIAAQGAVDLATAQGQTQIAATETINKAKADLAAAQAEADAKAAAARTQKIVIYVGLGVIVVAIGLYLWKKSKQNKTA